MAAEHRFKTSIEAIQFLQDQGFRLSGASRSEMPSRWIGPGGAAAVCVTLTGCNSPTVVVISSMPS